jgi:hypothetical protein
MSNQVRPLTLHPRMDKPQIPTCPPSEFRRHKDVTNPVYIMGFLTQWKLYLDQLPADPNGQAYRGQKLDPTMFEKASMPPFGVVGANVECYRLTLDVTRTACAAVRGDARY